MATYLGPSIVDYLNSIGQDSSFAARSRLAAQKGIQNYTGTANQNTQLLNTLRQQASTPVVPTPTPTPSPTPTPAPIPVPAPISTPTPSTGGTSSPATLQRAVLNAVADVATQAASIGRPTLSFAEALASAANDPNIIAKYADELKLDTQFFQQSLQQMQSDINLSQGNLATSFANEKRVLAEQEAAAGRAYSGFREQAKSQLDQSESGIIQSTRSQIQKNVQDLTTKFESKYGSLATSPATATFINPLTGESSSLSGQRVGGIVGYVGPAREQDIRNRALQSYQSAQFPQI